MMKLVLAETNDGEIMCSLYVNRKCMLVCVISTWDLAFEWAAAIVLDPPEA